MPCDWSACYVTRHIPSRLKMFCVCGVSILDSAAVVCRVQAAALQQIAMCMPLIACSHFRRLIAESKRSCTLHSQQLQADTRYVFTANGGPTIVPIGSTVSAFCAGTQRCGVPAPYWY
jgi:hypothetical protein